MKKFYIGLLLLGIFFLGACGRGAQENEVIGPFLMARADLYQEKDQIVKELQELTSSQIPPEEEKGDPEALENLKTYLAEGAYDRLVANRRLLEKDFFQEDIDKVQVENIQYKVLEEEEDHKEMDVTYEEVKTRAGKEEREKKEKIFRLKKENGSWKIFDIQDK